MSESSTGSTGVETMFDTVTTAVEANRSQAQQAWARGCGAYARYFDALARAKGPEGVFAANTALVNEVMDAWARGAAEMRRLDS